MVDQSVVLTKLVICRYMPAANLYVSISASYIDALPTVSDVNGLIAVIHCDTAVCFNLNDIHPLSYFEWYLHISFDMMLSYYLHVIPK